MCSNGRLDKVRGVVLVRWWLLLHDTPSKFNTEDLVSAPNLELGWCAVILHNCASDYTNCARCLVQV